MTKQTSAYFVTGTDTDVGKTVATAWLASELALHSRTAVVKPLQTGTTTPDVDGDEAFYRQHLNSTVTLKTIRSLPEPLAPSIAAQRIGESIELAPVVEQCETIIRDHDVTLVEGAGGLLVTINEREDMAALALALKAPLVVAIRPALGTLNHTMLTIEAAQRRGLKVDLLVCSGFPDDAGVVELENLRFLRDVFPSLPLVVLRMSDLIRGGLKELQPRILGPKPRLLTNCDIPMFHFDSRHMKR